VIVISETNRRLTKMKTKIAISLGIGLLIAAAPPASVPAIEPVVEVAGEDGLIFIYRAYAQPTAWAPAVRVDGRKIVGISNRSYTAVRVTPGDHIVTLKWPLIAAQGGAKMEVTVEKGKAHFVEVTGVSQYVPGVYMRTGSGIALVQPEYAVAAIKKCCKFQAPK
jgi:hypothetical protein